MLNTKNKWQPTQKAVLAIIVCIPVIYSMAMMAKNVGKVGSSLSIQNQPNLTIIIPRTLNQ